MESAAPLTAEQVPDLLLAAVPSLRAGWAEVAEEHADDEAAGGRLGYLDAAWVVGHLADRLAAGDTSELDGAFDLVERLVRDGDAYVAELGVIGYLEGLQTETVTSRGVDPEAFRPWLRPLSVRYWEAIHAFWEHGTLIPVLHPE